MCLLPRSTPACFFIKNDDVYLLNKALLYVTVSQPSGREVFLLS